MRFSVNLTGVFVLYITLPNVQNEDPVKIVLKSLSKGSRMILDRNINKEHRDLQLSTNLTGVFVLYITLPNVQNEDPFKIVLKSLPKGSNMILDRSILKHKQGAQRFAVINENRICIDRGVRFVHNPTKCTNRRPL